MADLVVGLSKTAVQLLADKVKSAIKEEAEQWKIVQRDLVFITGEFEMMQAFLDTATEEHVRNKVLRTWVRQVRNLSYDVEDCIDFVLHLDTTKRSWWLRLLPSCSRGKTGAELPVDEAVTETTLLRARVVDVSQRNIRYNLIVDSANKSMDQVQKTASATTSSFDTLINAVKKSGLLDLAGLIAREDTNLHVVSLCGTEGDLATVAIAKKMYSDSTIQNVFQCRAWVKVTHPFDAQEFIGCMVTQFFMQEVIEGIKAPERLHQAHSTQGDLIKLFAEKVNTHRYLIVLEDLYTIAQWEAIRSYLPDRKNGSRIILLTHQPLIASLCTGEPCRVSELRNFSPDRSVHVYFKEGFQHDRVVSFMKPEPYHSLVNYGLLGRDSELNELFEKAQQSHEGWLISVWGMPGVGKSSLVEALYHKLRRSNIEFKSHVWVSVSHPFNPTDFCRSLLVNLHRESTSSQGGYANEFRTKDPIEECQHYLHECVCLFVIDGVHSNVDWDWIKSNLIQYGNSRSCSIIITSEESVAKHCAVSIDGVYNVKGLGTRAATGLFEKVLEEEALEEEVWLHNVEDWREGRLLLSKCGGLPRVLITTARYLASKPKDVFHQEMSRLSDNFLHELMRNPEFDSLRDIQSWMHSYLHACPRHLKNFMLYLSIFPQDIIIRRRCLIRRWMAEGYSKGTDSNSMEKYAEKMFGEITALSIMQPVLTASKVVGYRVNGFFREYVLSRPAEETIFLPVEVSALEKQGHARLTTEGIGQHLAIWTTEDIDRILFGNLDLSRLRSLTVFGIFLSCFVSDRMRVLRVLDLENARHVEDSNFQEIGKLPSRLKFLSLRGHRKITRLPDSVGDLLQLQTLDIRDTSIATLPPFITKLRKLQYIRAGTSVAWMDDAEEESAPPSSSRSRTLASCLPNKFIRCGGPVVGSRSGGVEVPRGIKRLEALLTLGAVHVNTADGEAILDEISNSLPQLKKLEVSDIGGNHGGRSLLSLYDNTHLESLSLKFERNNHFVHCHGIFIPNSLRSLKMIGHVEQLPWNIATAVNLGKLTLEMTNALLTAVDIELLGCLPSLRTLRLHVNKDQQDGELQFPTAHFSKLQVLEIACKSKLHVTIDEGAMENLEQLMLHCLQGSGMQISGLEHPVSLKRVWLFGYFNDALDEAVQQQLDMHPKIPAPKLISRGGPYAYAWVLT